MNSTKIQFTNERGMELAGRIELPDTGSPRAWVIFAHCFTCTKNLSAVRRISRELTDEGLGVLSFDFTGLGDSEGEFAESTFATQAADLLSAVEYLKDTYGTGPAIMVGHSLGGTATLYAAREVPGLEGVATIGAPSDPAHVTNLFDCELEEIEQTGQARVSIGGRPFSIRKEFVDDLKAHPPSQWLGTLRSRVLIFHSPVDQVVDISNARDIYTAVKHPKSFVSLDRADHLLSRPADARHVARVLAAWADSFLPEAAAPTDIAHSPLQPADGYQIAARMGKTKYKVEMTNGRHHVLADEPPDVNGGDLGGNPFDYLLWSLAACTVMTVRMYADRKEWPLEAVFAQLSYQKVKMEELGQGTDIQIELTFTGDLDSEQEARLVEMAHRCPVHRTLIGPIRVRINP
ncbi:MAG TPA: alpha/beta fold hydrolase [Alkalispirochaeta sp.]|nr:alpha/beta fold hydrolase [Alkalispirochaeta sp.]